MAQPTSAELAATLLEGMLPWLSRRTKEIFNAFGRGDLRSIRPSLLVQDLHLRNRHELTRLLRGEGLPSVEVLRGWILVTGWTLEWERSGKSLNSSSLSSSCDPAYAYRLVKRTTSKCWTEVRVLGSAWLALQFRELCSLVEKQGRGSAETNNRRMA